MKIALWVIVAGVAAFIGYGFVLTGGDTTYADRSEACTSMANAADAVNWRARKDECMKATAPRK